MKLQHSKNPWPKVWSIMPGGKDIIAEASIKVSRHSRLRAKVLIFGSNAAMRRFWKKELGLDEVCMKTQAIVTSLSSERTSHHKDGTMKSEVYEVDPTFFCVMGFVQKYLRMEIVCHESVHAGFAYMARQNRKQWVRDTDALDEEEVAYPAGIIASSLNKFFHAGNHYQI